MIKDIAILLTCFNRRDTTLRCLEGLFSQVIPVAMDVFLCDDGSTDGTYEAVRAHFPQVFIDKGPGNLFWSRGMLHSWRRACAHKEYDAYIWLNDDAHLLDDALEEMLECSRKKDDKAIICGSFCNNNGCFSYGGKLKNYTPLIPNGKLQSLFWLNGNCVLVPKHVVDRIGLLDPMFIHHMGDYDYGLRALKNNIEVVTSTKYIGVCELNPILVGGRSRKNGLTLKGRFNRLYSPLGSNPIISFRYNLRHFGLKNAVFMFLAVHWNNLLTDNMYARKHNEKL